MSYEAWGDGDDGDDWPERAEALGWINPDNAGKAAIDVINERLRQVTFEGFSAEHDDAHDEGQIALAAATYAYAAALPARRRGNISGIYSLTNNMLAREIWPWELKWWKPTDRRRDLVKAAALIIAEIERLDRAAAVQAARPSEGPAGAPAEGEQAREAGQ